MIKANSTREVRGLYIPRDQHGRQCIQRRARYCWDRWGVVPRGLCSTETYTYRTTTTTVFSVSLMAFLFYRYFQPQDWLHALCDWTVSSEHLGFLFFYSLHYSFCLFLVPCASHLWLCHLTYRHMARYKLHNNINNNNNNNNSVFYSSGCLCWFNVSARFYSMTSSSMRRQGLAFSLIFL